MNLYDVNVLIYAYRNDFPTYAAVRHWLEKEFSGPSSFMISELVLAGYVRLVTNPRAFRDFTPLGVALTHVEAIRQNPLCHPINPGKRHFEIFTQLCRDGNATGKLVSDAYLAALAIEHGCRWFTFDRDFARFPGLDWAEPPIDRPK